MDKVSYSIQSGNKTDFQAVAIHNKNEQGFLLQQKKPKTKKQNIVAIHNKNGQGFLQYNTIW